MIFRRFLLLRNLSIRKASRLALLGLGLVPRREPEANLELLIRAADAERGQGFAIRRERGIVPNRKFSA